MNLQISYNWLKEFLKTDKSLKDFVRDFSLKSQTVDYVVPFKPRFTKVITAKILEITKHPDADKLQLAKVDAGKSRPTVVCGAPNIQVGQIVPYAQLGARVVDSSSDDDKTFIIKKANIRGQESNGMLCSQAELGLGTDHRGIMVLPTKTPIGKPLEEVLEINDSTLHIEVTTNRPDAMSVIGLALEGAAATGGKFKWRDPKINYKIEKELPLEVEVEDKKLCPRYQAVVMTDVKIGPSPTWMQLRLFQAGLRPINNVVDITNYVALEYGQPTHVFDYKKLQGSKIVVRPAKNGEKILALDGNTYKLSNTNLVIADSKVPVAVAGVMGGEQSSATANTTSIVFEAANFNPVSVRKTSRSLNLHSDSSSRFEKGLHPQATSFAIIRCMELAAQIAGAKIASKVLDPLAKKYQPTVVELDPAEIKRYLGISIAETEIKKILESLAFKVLKKKFFKVTVPWWRENDIKYDYDLVEEIARIYGYDNLPTALPTGEIPVLSKDLILEWELCLKKHLAGAGFSEVFNYSMISKDLLKKLKLPLAQAVRIDNPLNEEMEYMRTSLVPQILENVSSNVPNFPSLKIFELSHVYNVTGEKTLPAEISQLAGAITGDQNLFRQTKGTVEFILKNMGLLDLKFKAPEQSQLFDKDACLEIGKGGKKLGEFGLLKAVVLEAFGIKRPVGVFDLNFTELSKLATVEKTYREIPEFPEISRDLAIVIDQKISWEEIENLVSKSDSLIEKTEYLSTFTDKSLGQGKKSLAMRLTIRSKEKTLKSAEADQVVEKAVNKLKNKFNISLR